MRDIWYCTYFVSSYSNNWHIIFFLQPTIITSVYEAVYFYLIEYHNDYQTSRKKILNAEQNNQVIEEEDSPPIETQNQVIEDKDSPPIEAPTQVIGDEDSHPIKAPTQVIGEEDSPPIKAPNEPSEGNFSSFEEFGIVDQGAECPPDDGAAEDENNISDSDKQDTIKFHAPEVLLLTLGRDSRISTYKYVQEDEILRIPSGM